MKKVLSMALLSALLLVTASVASAALVATPNPVAFGEVPLNAIGSVRVTLYNNGTAPIYVNQVTTSAPFLVLNTSFTIQPGGSHGITIGFAPTTTGDFEGKCTFVDLLGNTQLLVLPLTGRGVEE